MTNSEKSTKVIVLVALLAIVVWAVWSNKIKQLSLNKFPAETTSNQVLQRSSDLDSAQDQLDSVNVNSVDSGINQVGVEVGKY